MAGGSVDLVNRELERFLTDQTPDALAIIGDWGSGKTYAWSAAVKKVKADKTKTIARPGYAYVSLFGIGSIAQLNVAVFQNSITTQATRSAQEKDAILKLGRLATKLRSLPLLRGYGEAAEVLMAFEIRDRIVCFDDLERKSPNLNITELLGFASFLKERRNCKIAFITHTDKIDEKDEFEKLSEKVVDITLRFVRSPQDAAQIAIEGDAFLASAIREKCVALGITNIRVIRQIWRLARSLEPMLGAYEPTVLQQAIHSLVLLGWCRLQPKIAPNEDFVLKRRGEVLWASDEQASQATTEEKAWAAVLDRYGFGYCDEFDLVLARGVADGYFDPDAVRSAAEPKHKLAISEKAGSSVHDAWATFHDSLDKSEEEVATAIHEAVTKHAEFVSPANLDGAVRMLKELGFPDKARSLLDHYLSVHAATERWLNLGSYAFRDEVKDPEVIAAFRAKNLSIPDNRDALEDLGNRSNGAKRLEAHPAADGRRFDFVVQERGREHQAHHHRVPEGSAARSRRAHGRIGTRQTGARPDRPRIPGEQNSREALRGHGCGA